MQSYLEDHSGVVLSTDLQMTDSHRLPLAETADASAYFTDMYSKHTQNLQHGMNTGVSRMETSTIKSEHVAREDLMEELTAIDANRSHLVAPTVKKSSPPPIPPRSSRRLSRKFNSPNHVADNHKLNDASKGGFAVPMDVDDYMVTAGPQPLSNTLQSMSVPSLALSSGEESTYDEKKLPEVSDGSLYEEYKDEIGYNEDDFGKENDGTSIYKENLAPLLDKPSKKSGRNFSLAGTKRHLEQKLVNGAKRIFSSKKQNNSEDVEKSTTTYKQPFTPSKVIPDTSGAAVLGTPITTFQEADRSWVHNFSPNKRVPGTSGKKPHGDAEIDPFAQMMDTFTNSLQEMIPGTMKSTGHATAKLALYIPESYFKPRGPNPFSDDAEMEDAEHTQYSSTLEAIKASKSQTHTTSAFGLSTTKSRDTMLTISPIGHSTPRVVPRNAAKMEARVGLQKTAMTTPEFTSALSAMSLDDDSDTDFITPRGRPIPFYVDPKDTHKMKYYSGIQDKNFFDPPEVGKGNRVTTDTGAHFGEAGGVSDSAHVDVRLIPRLDSNSRANYAGSHFRPGRVHSLDLGADEELGNSGL